MLRPSTHHSVALRHSQRTHWLFYVLFSLLAFVPVAVTYNVTVTNIHVLQMDNALFDELSPKPDPSLGSFSNPGSSTQDIWQPDPMQEISECDQSQNSPNLAQDPRREEAEAEEKNVPLTVISPRSQFDQMDQSMSRWNNSISLNDEFWRLSGFNQTSLNSVSIYAENMF